MQNAFLGITALLAAANTDAMGTAKGDSVMIATNITFSEIRTHVPAQGHAEAIHPSWNEVDVDAYMAQLDSLRANGYSEVVVRNEKDGRLYLVYFPAMRSAIPMRGQRFESDQISGTVVVESGTDTAVDWVHAVGMFAMVGAGVILVAAAGTGNPGLVVLGGLVGVSSGILLSSGADAPTDLTGLDAFSRSKPTDLHAPKAIPTSPATSLAPCRP